MQYRFLLGRGSLKEEYLIMLTCLNETLKPNPERILDILKVNVIA